MSESTETKKKWFYYTQIQMNRPLRLFGLNTGQLALVIVGIVLTAIISLSVLGIGILGLIFLELIIIFPVIFLSSKLQKEQKLGNYNFINSYMAFTSTPKKIIDKNRCLKFLIKSE